MATHTVAGECPSSTLGSRRYAGEDARHRGDSRDPTGGRRVGGGRDHRQRRYRYQLRRHRYRRPRPAGVYRMTQDLVNAEVRSTVKLGGATVTMRSYTADSDNTFVTELSTPAGSPSVPITVDLALPGPDSHTTYPTTVGGSGGTVWVTRRNNLTGAS